MMRGWQFYPRPRTTETHSPASPTLVPGGCSGVLGTGCGCFNPGSNIQHSARGPISRDPLTRGAMTPPPCQHCPQRFSPPRTPPRGSSGVTAPANTTSPPTLLHALAAPGHGQPPLGSAWCCERSLTPGKLGSPRAGLEHPGLPSSQGSCKDSTQVGGHWDPQVAPRDFPVTELCG